MLALPERVNCAGTLWRIKCSWKEELVIKYRHRPGWRCCHSSACQLTACLQSKRSYLPAPRQAARSQPCSAGLSLRACCSEIGNCGNGKESGE